MTEGVSTRLTLKDVEKELEEVTDYHSLGLQLDVPQAVVKHIEADYHGSCRRKSEVLNWWLANVKDASWAVLGEAVERMGKHGLLAESLKEKIDLCLNDNGDVQRTPLVTSMPSSTEYSGKEWSNDSIYNIHNTEDVIPGCKGTRSELSESHLESETYKIRAAFNVLWTKLRRSLQQQNVEVKDFVSFLKGVPAHTSNEKSLFAAAIPSLSQMTDLIDVFERVLEYCSWFNFSLIGDIITAYCENDRSIKEAKADYCDQLRKYCKHRVCKCHGSLKNGFGFGRRRDCMHITVKVDLEWNSIRIEQLEEVMHCLAMILKTQRHTLYLRSIDKGCIELEILAPEVINVLFPLSMEQEAALVDVNIIHLHCNDYHFSSHLMIQSHAETVEQITRLEAASNTLRVLAHRISNYPVPNNQLQLYTACRYGGLDSIKSLVTMHNQNPQSTDLAGNTPLHIACLFGNLDVAKYLISECNCNPECANTAGITPLHAACQNAHIHIVKYLITETNCNPQVTRTDGTTPLHIACLFGSLDVAKYLISECNCNPECANTVGDTPLHAACQNGHIHIVKYLVTERNCNPQVTSICGTTPLHFACWFGHLDLAKYLAVVLQCNPHCAQVDGTMPLHFACLEGHIDVVKYLITECMCTPHGVDSKGVAPLHLSCLNGHLSLVKCLISEHNCNPHCADIKGNTPLHYACENGHLNLIKYLITKYGCKPSSTSINGATPLHAACKYGHTSAARYLITECHADPHCQKRNGITPLHFASYHGHIDTVKYLIEDCRCNPELPDGYGNTPLSLAQRNSHPVLTAYLAASFAVHRPHWILTQRRQKQSTEVSTPHTLSSTTVDNMGIKNLPVSFHAQKGVPPSLDLEAMNLWKTCKHSCIFRTAK